MSTLFILQSAQNPNIFPLFLLAMFAIMYIFFILPQKKKQKAQVQFQNELSKGEEVVTTSGIIGKINKVENTHIQLQLDQKTFINVLHSAISKEMSEEYKKQKSE